MSYLNSSKNNLQHLQLQGEAKYFEDTSGVPAGEGGVQGAGWREMTDLEEFSDVLICDLLRVGLLEQSPAQGSSSRLVPDPRLSLFSQLLLSYDVRLVPMRVDGLSVHFCTGMLSSRADANQVTGAPLQTIPAGGQGMAPADAALSCLGELSERLSLFSTGRRDSRVVGKSEIQSQIDVGPVLGFSPAQERAMVKTLMSCRRVSTDGLLDWGALSDRRVSVCQLGRSFRGELPSFSVLLGETAGLGKGLPSLASSIGCAVWPGKAGARERALLELIERDAVAQCWYNRLGITRIQTAVMREILPQSLSEFLEKRSRHWNLLAVETDLSAHVVAAISYEPDGSWAAFGSSAGWSFAGACQSAVEEMLQSENSLSLMDKVHPETAEDRHKARKVPDQLVYARTRSILLDLPVREAAPADEDRMRKTYDYATLLDSCLNEGIAIWEFDATREDLGIPCLKLLSPDLCTWEPRFGKRRLYDGVVQRGHRTSPAPEEEFSVRPFPF